VFLTDQRGARVLEGVLNKRLLSLRSAMPREREDLQTREIVRFKVEEAERKERRRKELSEKSKEEIELLFAKVPGEPEHSDAQEISEDSEVDDSDSEWEDIEEVKTKDTSKMYNTWSLKHFAQECDRYCISDRAGAKIGNGLLKDLGIVYKGSTDKLICPSKLRRERAKWGARLDKEASSVQLPGGLYTDGKRVPTLVRQTTDTKVQVPGGRGKKAYRTVTSTSNQLVIEDHYPVVAEPGGQYVTHLTPENGTGLALAKEIVTVVRERKAPVR
jgi:hypothetical protein